MKTTIHNPRRMGAIPLEGSTSFRVWAPNATTVSVVGEFNNWNPETHPLEREEGGIWAREVEGAAPGNQYQFEIANGDRRFRKNDAYAREIHAKTALSVIYADAYEWKSSAFAIPNWNELVIYELHVGTFAPGPYGNRLYRDLIHLRRNLHGNTKGLMGPFVRILHVNNQDKVIAFHRWAEGGPKDDVIVIASFMHRALEEGYRIGLPRGGRWIIRFNSDWKGYSPDFHDVSNPEGQIVAEKKPYDGCEYSGIVSLPPYGFLLLSQEETFEESESNDKKQEG